LIIYRLSIYNNYVIRSFRCKEAEKLFQGVRSRTLQAVEKTAYRRLAQLHEAVALVDLRSPGNSLEALGAERAGRYSIRVNDRYRVCFTWQDGDALDVEIVDYH
jgi:toxin HigB-1